MKLDVKSEMESGARALGGGEGSEHRAHKNGEEREEFRAARFLVRSTHEFN